MMNITVGDLRHNSPEFDATYEFFAQDIPIEFLEDREFLRNRLRVRDEGPKSEQERMLVQNGYTLHLLAGKLEQAVVGAIYGHVISCIGNDNRAAGFVTYISVLKHHRRKGIGSKLLSELRRRLEQDSLKLTGNPLVGIFYEIEAEGKKDIKRLLRGLNAAPLDIDYYQPALHASTSPEPMLLWFQPLDPPLKTVDQARSTSYPVEFVKSMILNLLRMEYVGADLKGFDPESKPYTMFLSSLAGKREIKFRV